MATLKQIHDFLLLAEELHFARAAEKLGISQAALSLEVRKLERSLGAQLFDRSDRWKIRLTEAGHAYFNRIGPLPELMKSAREAARRASRGEEGKLSVILSNAVYDAFDVGALFRRMFQRYPGVKLKIQDRLSSPQAAEMVRSGECDVGIFAYIHHASTLDGLRYIRIMESDIALALPARHPLAGKADLGFDDLRHCGFIFPAREEMPVLRRLFEEYFMAHCHTLPVIEHEAVGFRAIRQLVAAGLGVALVPGDRPDRNIVFRELPDGLRRSIVAAWDGGNHSPALRNFLSLIPTCEPAAVGA